MIYILINLKFISHCYYEKSKSLLNLKQAGQKANTRGTFKIEAHNLHELFKVSKLNVYLLKIIS